MKKHFNIAFLLSLLFLAGCTSQGIRSDESTVSSQPKDTLYSEKAVLRIYGTQPERALRIIDSAELLDRYTCNVLHRLGFRWSST